MTVTYNKLTGKFHTGHGGRATDDPLKNQRPLVTQRLEGEDGRLVPGYTGFIAGIQHEFAATYGQATKHASAQSLPTDSRNPAKWKHFTLPFEQYDRRDNFIPYHLPGYGGFIPASKSENVFGKSFSHVTFDIKHGHHATGAVPETVDRWKTTTGDAYQDPLVNAHAPPKRAEKPPMDLDDPDRPTIVAVCAVRNNPHDLKHQSNLEPGEYHLPGYTGHVMGLTSENLHSQTFGKHTRASMEIRTLPPLRKTLKTTSSGAQRTDAAKTYHIPGYCGFVPGVKADNLHAHTYADCSRLSKTLPHISEEMHRDPSFAQLYPPAPPAKPLCAAPPHFRPKELVGPATGKQLTTVVKGGRNVSAGWMDDRQHCGPELFSSSVNENFKPIELGAQDRAPSFPKCPIPALQNWPNRTPTYTCN